MAVFSAQLRALEAQGKQRSDQGVRSECHCGGGLPGPPAAGPSPPVTAPAGSWSPGGFGVRRSAEGDGSSGGRVATLRRCCSGTGSSEPAAVVAGALRTVMAGVRVRRGLSHAVSKTQER